MCNKNIIQVSDFAAFHGPKSFILIDDLLIGSLSVNFDLHTRYRAQHNISVNSKLVLILYISNI